MHLNDTTISDFWQRVIVPGDEEACWGWTGRVNEDGTAVLSVNGTGFSLPASRISWILHFEEDAEGARVMRSCKNGLCTNPKHLELNRGQFNENRFWGYVDIILDSDSCWEWQASTMEWGYGRFYAGKERGVVPAHRIAYELENGPIPDGLIVRHKCDNPPCCNPAHLELGTYADNTRDMIERGRQPRGENHRNAVLTQEDVDEIRRRLGPRGSQARLAEEFGVSPATITYIKQNKIWRE